MIAAHWLGARANVVQRDACSREREHGTQYPARRADGAHAETEKSLCTLLPSRGPWLFLVLLLTYVGHGFTRKAAVHGTAHAVVAGTKSLT